MNRHGLGCAVLLSLVAACAGSGRDSSAVANGPGNEVKATPKPTTPAAAADPCTDASVGGTPQVIVEVLSKEKVVVAHLAGNDSACLHSRLSTPFHSAATHDSNLKDISVSCNDASACTLQIPFDAAGEEDTNFATLEGDDAKRFRSVFRIDDGQGFETRAETLNGSAEVSCTHDSCDIVIATASGEVPDLPLKSLINPTTRSRTVSKVPPCTPTECGPEPGMPSQLCPDGITVAGPGPCERINGVCGFNIVTCPVTQVCPPAGTINCMPVIAPEDLDSCGKNRAFIQASCPDSHFID